ncbi:hypothetical protein FCOIX_1658 [Fusarium coicis]|nr:hypothetical protein FCOIX_1658 [Fusarium coicis]
MSEENPQANNPSENFTPGSGPQAPDSNADMVMARYEPRPEPPNKPNHFPPEFAAEDTPQFFHQDVPENVHVNYHCGPDNSKSQERIPREQVHGYNIPSQDELESHTGSRVRFDENLPSRRSRENESRRMGSHGGGSHRGQSHRDEPHGTDDRDRKSHKKESHYSKTSKSHRLSAYKDSHRSGSDRKDYRSESRRSDCQKRDSHKSSKKEDPHKKKTIDATPEYGRISFLKTVTNYVQQTDYVRNPVNTKNRRN